MSIPDAYCSADVSRHTVSTVSRELRRMAASAMPHDGCSEPQDSHIRSPDCQEHLKLTSASQVF